MMYQWNQEGNDERDDRFAHCAIDALHGRQGSQKISGC